MGMDCWLEGLFGSGGERIWFLLVRGWGWGWDWGGGGFDPVAPHLYCICVKGGKSIGVSLVERICSGCVGCSRGC